MSFLRSRPLAESQEALLAAAADVAENSLFTFAELSDQATFDGAANDGGAAAWLQVSIRFSGPADGCFELAAPEALSRRLCSAFAGTEAPDDIDDNDLLDFAGELANMICGAWLTRASAKESFDLTSPRVGRDRPAANHRAAVDSTHYSLYLTVDDAPVRLNISRRGPSVVDGQEHDDAP